MGRPLIVKDTAAQGVGSGVVAQVSAGRILIGARRLLEAAPLGGCDEVLACGGADSRCWPAHLPRVLG